MSRRLPPLESLRFFEACARHSSFTRAATELGITPAAVSLRIRDLESDVGVRLFHRSGPKIELTGAGAALAGRMTEAMRQIRAAVEDCRGGADALRVTVAPTFATRW
ncbi:MAG TPA: LysR family transcriptional regulator, partial [Steroidobacteraceae bacterium]|nr:LysR family transcriptional regulator [Steroidobacteraceae bacterium]